ncbi:type II toxin-antitoxin system HipA family toxin [Pseudomonas sp. PA-6-1D]|nr:MULTISPECIES: type II toxin-antitoxin system HipA family toxin [unclassified Pseudomonas]MCF5144106.1 type II toxin-antitoxin system HipA family toxin [Pseudomonas sp. PA-6-3C]MCF5148407.1 type II toxin-antitoxin system HipA family toxin [Pseudomonas sp. PA-6-3F]MCF5158632.1 type II toxin-antitoxin system HipA family toxin [Pseudomonas sp. PA-6-2E]MCF5177986.1 type II toxin-antitoxin system HipA family toxin [Pseudomonas sp. PA-6-1D]MCF5193720.1 type II toxin-antitoxin system HipA family to
MNSPALSVHTPQGDSGSVLVGADDYLFRYDAKAQAQSAISLTMPVRAEEYRRRELHPIFQMNLPEGYVLEQLRNRLAKTVKVDPMLLLALSGSSAPIGRVFVISDQINELIQRNGPPANGESLAEILAWDGAEDLFADLVDRYILRAGISGVQPKVLVPEKPQTPEQKFTSKTNDLIIKSGRDEFPGLAINEYLCMSIARDAGLPVPPFYLSQNHKLFIMRRFDRDAQLNPLGFEDMTTLMGLSAEQKYTKSYAAIAKAVRAFCSPENQRSSLDQLFDSVALSCIVGNGDAHLKNFGVLYSDPIKFDARLAPAYDIVNTTAYIPEDTLALDLSGNKSMFASRLGILEFARTCEIAEPQARIQALLQTLEVVLKREDEYCRLAPDVAKAIRQSAQSYQQSFGG